MANRFLNNIRINDAYTFPASDGNDGQVITTDGAGNLAFENVSPDAASVIYRDNFTGDGSTVTFDLQNSITDEDQTQIYIDGVYQEKSTYSISGTTITFTTAPILGHSVEVISISSINTGPTVLYQDNFTGTGSTTVFTLGQIIDNEIKTFIFLNGVYQFKNTYTLDGTTLTFDTAPANGVAIEVISIASATQSDSLQAGAVIIPVKNTHTASISKGTPVYITGNVGASERLQIAPADASNSAKMPAAGLLLTTLAVNAEGYVITGGYLRNITTDTIDGTSTTSNDTVYVKAGGGLTMTKPTGSNLIQNIAKVARSASGSAGSLIVSSILRTNDIPNLTTGKIWVGDSNTVESTVIHLDESNNRLGINNTSPSYSLDVTGDANISNNVIVGGNLTVQGTETILNTQTVEVEDNILQLNTTQGSPDTATATTSGISIYRGNGVTQASFIFDDADDTWDLTDSLFVAGTTSAASFITTNTSGYMVRDSSVSGYGLFKSSSTNIGLASNGSVALDIDSSGITTLTTGATYHKIQTFFDGSYTSGFKFSDYNGGIWYDAGADDLILNAGQANSQMLFQVAGSERMRINNSGTIIGTGTYSAGGSIKIFEGQRSGGAVAGDWSYDDATTDMSLGTSTAHSFSLKTGNTRALTINSSQNATFAGNVTLSQPINGAEARLILTSKSAAGNSRTGIIEYDADVEKIFFINEGTTIAAMTSDGKVGIGTDSPESGAKLDVRAGAGGKVVFGSYDANYKVVIEAGDQLNFYNGTSATTAYINYSQTGTPGDVLLSRNLLVEANSSGGVSGTVRIKSNGDVGIGTTTPSAKLDIAGIGKFSETFSTLSNSDAGSYLYTNPGGRLLTSNASGWYADGRDPILTLSSSGNSNSTIIGNSIGLNLHNNSNVNGTFGPLITFSSLSESSSYNSAFAAIGGVKRGRGPDTNWTTGDLCFWVTGPIASNPASYIQSTPSMVIQSGGNVGIGTASPSRELDVENSADNAIISAVSSTTHIAGLVLGDTADDDKGGILYNNTLDYLYFLSNGSERMRITSGGEVLIRRAVYTDTTFSLQVGDGASDSYRPIRCEVASTSTRTQIAFYNPVGNIGTISTTSSSTAYNTSSDYRLKENVVEMTGALDRVSQLKPSRFNFILDADRTVDGFLAHEVQEIVPEAITGKKDAVDEEGNPVYQGIDQSKLVPLLVGAIKELKAEVETLKNQINGIN